MKIILSILFWMVTAVLTLAVFLAVLILAIPTFPFDRKRKLSHAQGFWWADAIVASNPFWNINIRGLEHINPQKAYVVVSNHQSFADIVMLYKTHMQFKWVAKESLFKVPVFGWCMSSMKYIRLSRGEFGSIKKTYRQAAEWLRQGVSVLFFPEGTRSGSDDMNAFKNGAFKLAIKEKKPILPVRIDGSREVIPRGSWIFKARASCRLSVLPEIDTSSFSPKDFIVLRDKVHEILRTAQN
jgi:1-acyl-sn-glycerol-3-phosphate acyltransferase